MIRCEAAGLSAEMSIVKLSVGRASRAEREMLKKVEGKVQLVGAREQLDCHVTASG